MNRICSTKHQAVCKALLRFCELDTAMVMIWEAWQDKLEQAQYIKD
jgi:hypothetical protein